MGFVHVGPLGPWHRHPSGSHGVFLLSAVCRLVWLRTKAIASGAGGCLRSDHVPPDRLERRRRAKPGQVLRRLRGRTSAVPTGIYPTPQKSRTRNAAPEENG